MRLQVELPKTQQSPGVTPSLLLQSTFKSQNHLQMNSFGCTQTHLHLLWCTSKPPQESCSPSGNERTGWMQESSWDRRSSRGASYWMSSVEGLRVPHRAHEGFTSQLQRARLPRWACRDTGDSHTQHTHSLGQPTQNTASSFLMLLGQLNIKIHTAAVYKVSKNQTVFEIFWLHFIINKDTRN